MYLRKCQNLLGLLRIITQEVAGSKGVFTRLQHALTQAHGRKVHLLAAVHKKLDAWRNLLTSLLERPTHMHGLETPSPPYLDRGNRRLGQRHGGRMLGPRGPLFHMALPIFRHNPGEVDLLCQPQRGNYNQRPGAWSYPNEAPPFCSMNSASCA